MEIIKKFLNFKEIQPKMPTSVEFFSTYRNQNFSLPNSIIYYIARNPKSSKSYQKWIKVCKYFFAKNPILIINSLRFGEKLPQKILSTKSNIKIWITGGFLVNPLLPNETFQKLFSSIFLKIYCKSEILRLCLFDISLTFDEFKFLSSSAEAINLNNVSIKYQNGKDVELEKIVEISSNAKKFE
uniref:Ribosomal protein S2 n=1 Tax=Panagrolaimus davidi TaxID=227884 RepID=A0A914PF00_9BILA